MSKLMEEIKDIVNKVCEDELSALVLKEELLFMAVRSRKIKLTEKTPMFKEIERINKRQLEILGHTKYNK